MKRRHSPGPTIAIIGSGFGGIGMAIELRKAGMSRFTIYEKASGVGGTWWHNDYPGAEVDTPSVLYSFSFAPWNWSRTHVRQPEFLEYIENVVDQFDLRGHIVLNTAITRTVWDEELQQWELFDGSGHLIDRVDIVVSAVGMLSDPKRPDWPGLAEFEGPTFHTAEWEHGHDLAGKSVAVVGSGSTAVQVVPALARTVGHLYMFQREPGWVIGKSDRALTPQERTAMNSKLAQRVIRTMIIMQREVPTLRGKVFRAGSKENLAGEKAARRHLQSQLGDRPDLLEAVTPRHAYMSKRPIVTDDFYPALKRDNVTLVARAVQSVTARGIVDADGVEHPVDAIVFSTGFKASFLSTLQVVGRNGVELQDAWKGESRAFLGMMVPDYPNFFIMYGPNTNAGSIITNLELQASYIVAAIKKMTRAGSSAIEVRKSAYDRFDRWLMGRMAGTAFQYEHNYYKSESGRVATQWPDSVMLYGVATKVLRQFPWRLSRELPRTQITTAQANEKVAA